MAENLPKLWHLTENNRKICF